VPLRAFFVAVVAIGGAAWAYARHLTYVPPPMHVPVPVQPHPDELPAPEVVEVDAGR
jgi:hypothetical protein